MKIVETLNFTNAKKPEAEPREIRLEVDTETGEVTFNLIANFTQPKVNLKELREKLDLLASYSNSL